MTDLSLIDPDEKSTLSPLLFTMVTEDNLLVWSYFVKMEFQQVIWTSSIYPLEPENPKRIVFLEYCNCLISWFSYPSFFVRGFLNKNFHSIWSGFSLGKDLLELLINLVDTAKNGPNLSFVEFYWNLFFPKSSSYFKKNRIWKKWIFIKIPF